MRIGVFGGSRGLSLALQAAAVGMEVVAVCDKDNARRQDAADQLGAMPLARFDALIEQDIDAVVVANDFDQHAPFAIEAMEAGKHVLSETTACRTLAEGVQLVEAAERTGRTYMLAENYPFMVFHQEMRRLYQAGELGELQYAEGEYIHPFDPKVLPMLVPHDQHWRKRMPATYYCTHSIAPSMYVTDTMPVAVNGFVVPLPPPEQEVLHRRGGTAGVIMLRMDNGGIVRSVHGGLRGEHSGLRIHGSHGFAENPRGVVNTSVRVHKERFDKALDEHVERVYAPDFPEFHEEAAAAGHMGGDFFVMMHFLRALRGEEAPYFDVYKAVALSACGILAFRSAVHGSRQELIPDFRDPAARRAVADDDWFPTDAEIDAAGAGANAVVAPR